MKPLMVVPLVLGLVLLGILVPAQASPDWWNTAWSCRKAITVTELSGSALTDYQVKIDLSYEPTMRTDFGDLRFTNASDSPLDYWLEAKTDGDSATVWVEVDAITASDDTVIYMYYGNPAADSASNGDATFEFFDDFEDGDISDWSQYRNGIVNITDDGGNYVLLKTAYNDSNGGYCLFNNGSLSDFEAIFRTNRINETGGNQNRYGIENGSFNGYGPRMRDFNSLPSAFSIERRTGGGGGNLASKNTSAYEWNTWMTVKFRKYGSTIEFELYDSSGSLAESISATNTSYNNFDRFVVHGGWEFYTDDIIVRKYVFPEPSCSFGAEECNQPPDIPTLVSPSDGETGVDVTPDLVFNYFDLDGDTCTVFDLQVDDDSDFSSPEVDETDYSTGGPWLSGNDITYPVSSPLSSGTQQYWKVRAFDGTVWSEWSDGTWDFTTNSAPDSPGGLNPTRFEDGSWVDDNTPTLGFTQSDPEGDTLSYTIQIDDDADFSSPVVDYTSALLAEGEASFTVGQAQGDGAYAAGSEGQSLDDGDYYWRVMSTDQHGAESGWSAANGGDIAFRLNTVEEVGYSFKGKYRTNEDVSVSGGGFVPGSEVDVYLVAEGEWLGGETIANYGIVALKTLTANGDGEIEGVVWEAPLEVGEYDVVFDANQNGIYDEVTDFVSHPNHPGFVVVGITVGGVVYPVDKAALLIPWLGLALLLALGGAALRQLRG